MAFARRRTGAVVWGLALLGAGASCSSEGRLGHGGGDEGAVSQAIDPLSTSQQAKLLASDGAAADALGAAVAVSGDTALVGAPEDDDKGQDAGAVYVFTRRNTTSPWAQQAYVKASNPMAGAEFGHVVTLSADGNTMAVSAYFEASATKGINGNQADDSAQSAGALKLTAPSRVNACVRSTKAA